VGKEDGILLLTLPPHTSLCTVFGPHKTHCSACGNNSMLSKQGKILTVYSFGRRYWKTLSKALTKHKIEKGFHVTRIFPLHENIFGKDEFLSPYVTDRPYCQLTGPASDVQVPGTKMKKEHQLGL
jgi:hypothetical protein